MLNFEKFWFQGYKLVFAHFKQSFLLIADIYGSCFLFFYRSLLSLWCCNFDLYDSSYEDGCVEVQNVEVTLMKKIIKQAQIEMICSCAEVTQYMFINFNPLRKNMFINFFHRLYLRLK